MANVFAKGLLLSVTIGLLAACNDPDTRPQIDIEGKTMGTFYSVKVSGDVAVNKQQLQQQIDAVLERANDDISTYRNDSVLSRFNQTQSTEPQPIPRGMADIILMAQRIGRDTQGAMNITVGPLVNLWGFGPDKRVVKVPSQQQIEAAQKILACSTSSYSATAVANGCKRTYPGCMLISRRWAKAMASISWCS